jgi:hypothetical protein
MSAWGLTPEEDAELRRLHFMLRFGAVASRFTQRYVELRRRDRRIEVREPDDAALAALALPAQRSRDARDNADDDHDVLGESEVPAGPPESGPRAIG